MNDETLEDLLGKLHRALNAATPTTEKDRELLEQLSADVERLLAKPGTITATEHRSLLDRIMVAVTRFEVSHPDLTATMAQVSKSLGDMGI